LENGDLEDQEQMEEMLIYFFWGLALRMGKELGSGSCVEGGCNVNCDERWVIVTLH
jgi:hypothetical protein